MPWCSSVTLVILLSSACTAQTAVREHRAAQLSAACEPQASGALVARPSDVRIKPVGHTIVASNISLIEAKCVEGSCASEIVRFNIGHAFLPSGQIFRIRNDGTIQLHPPQGLHEKHDIPVETGSLPGYRLVMAERVLASLEPGGKSQPYIGVFKSKSDYVIARFDLLDGKPSKEAEVLIRSRSPIGSVDYLPAPDTPEGRFGFVQRAGPDQAWLYTYDWNHGPLRPLAL